MERIKTQGLLKFPDGSRCLPIKELCTSPLNGRGEFLCQSSRSSRIMLRKALIIGKTRLN